MFGKVLKKNMFGITSPLPEKELTGSVPDVNELIILSEFILFIFFFLP
mgnify:CR=1 FL=1